MNQHRPPIVDEIWAMMKEYRKDMDRSKKEAEESRKREEESRKKAEEKAEREMEKFRIGMEETKKIVRETSEQMKKTDEQMKETSEQIKETKEAVRETSEQMKRTDEQMEKTDKKLNKMIGDTGNNFGKLGENLVKGNLAKRLKEKGIEVERVLTNAKNKHSEFDIIAINGKEVVVVEVKSSLDPSDVREFKEDMNQFTKLWPEFKDRTIYGAMAYLMKSNRQADSIAEKHGFFVISATGDIVITNRKDFKPKVFN